MVLYSNYIVLEHGIFEGFLELENGKIKGLYEKWQGEYKDYSDKIIFPGFIDIHVHGWATGSFWFEKTSQSLREMCRTLPFAGVTSYLGTTGADPIEEIKTCIRAADQVSEEDPEGAQLLGVHLEGPFINPVYKGMQKEECCLLPDVTVMEDLYNTFKNKKLCRRNGREQMLFLDFARNTRSRQLWDTVQLLLKRSRKCGPMVLGDLPTHSAE